MKLQIIYQDSDITITKDFIWVQKADREVINVCEIKEITITKIETGDYKGAALVFIVIGLMTVWIQVGWLFLAWGIAAWFTKIHKYTLFIRTSSGYRTTIAHHKRKSRLIGILRTLQGLSLSHGIRTLSTT